MPIDMGRRFWYGVGFPSALPSRHTDSLRQRGAKLQGALPLAIGGRQLGEHRGPGSWSLAQLCYPSCSSLPSTLIPTRRLSQSSWHRGANQSVSSKTLQKRPEFAPNGPQTYPFAPPSSTKSPSYGRSYQPKPPPIVFARPNPPSTPSIPSTLSAPLTGAPCQPFPRPASEPCCSLETTAFIC